MAGAATAARAGAPRGGAGAAGRAGKPAAAAGGIPKGGWQFADLSDPRQLASYKRQLASRGVDEAEGLDTLRKLQRAQAGSGGRASDDKEPTPEPAGGATPAKRAGGSGVRPTLTPPSSLRGSDGGGFLLGLLLFGLGSSYLRYGNAGILSWLGAKFLNRPDPKIVAAETARGVIAKTHKRVGLTPSVPPSFLNGTPPKGTPQVPPSGRFGR